MRLHLTVFLISLSIFAFGATPDIQVLREKAQRGDAEAQFVLARHVLLNDRATAEALVWYEKSAEQNYVIAAQTLANLYRTGLKDRLEPAPEKALHWQTVAAETGDLSAMYALGQLYQHGFGDTWPEFKTSRDTANQWYLKASNAGYAMATVELINYFIEFRYYDYAYEAAGILTQQKPAEGHFYLGLLSENGWGCNTDQAVAIEHYQKAAAKKNTRAQRALDRIKRTSAPKGATP